VPARGDLRGVRSRASDIRSGPYSPHDTQCTCALVSRPGFMPSRAVACTPRSAARSCSRSDATTFASFRGMNRLSTTLALVYERLAPGAVAGRPARGLRSDSFREGRECPTDRPTEARLLAVWPVRPGAEVVDPIRIVHRQSRGSRCGWDSRPCHRCPGFVSRSKCPRERRGVLRVDGRGIIHDRPSAR